MARAHRSYRILLTCLLVGCCCAGCGDNSPRVRIAGREWNVEVADDNATRSKGLAGRKEVPEGTGMLFVFGGEQVLDFHMLNCHVPLDVAFISARGTVVHVRTMKVEADPANPTAVYSSKWPAQFAIEVAAGSLEKAGVKVGDRAEFMGSARDAAKGAR